MLAAVKGDRTLSELAEQLQIHPNLIASWKRQLLEGADDVFGGAAPRERDHEGKVKELRAKIGQLSMENDSLSTALGRVE